MKAIIGQLEWTTSCTFILISIQFSSIYSNQPFVDTVINKVWRVTKKMNDGYGPRKAQLMIGASGVMSQNIWGGTIFARERSDRAGEGVVSPLPR